MLIHSGITLMKYWFSVSARSSERVLIRPIDPTGGKLSPMDLESPGALGRVFEGQRRDVFPHRHQAVAMAVVEADDKKRARLEAIKHVLLKFDYEGKNAEVIGEPDKLLIGPPSVLSEHNPDRVFPEL